MEESDIDLTVAGTAQALNMVEAGAKESARRRYACSIDVWT